MGSDNRSRESIETKTIRRIVVTPSHCRPRRLRCVLAYLGMPLLTPSFNPEPTVTAGLAVTVGSGLNDSAYFRDGLFGTGMRWPQPSRWGSDGSGSMGLSQPVRTSVPI